MKRNVRSFTSIAVLGVQLPIAFSGRTAVERANILPANLVDRTNQAFPNNPSLRAGPAEPFILTCTTCSHRLVSMRACMQVPSGLWVREQGEIPYAT